MRISLFRSRGYEWTSAGDVSFRGYLLPDGESSVLRGEAAARYLAGAESAEDLAALLRAADGAFAVVIRRGERTLAAVDRARSMPLYVSADGEVLSDSSEEVRRLSGIEKEDVDPEALAALLGGDYLLFHKTAYAGILGLDLGEVAEIGGGRVAFSRYFEHICPKKALDGEEFLLIADRAFARLKAAIAGRPVMLSMSGGYDSRFVGCMLKRAGVENVSCYTYGKSDSFEAAQAKKNAEAFGFPWHFVEYTDEVVRSILDEEGEKFVAYGDQHDAMGYLQNYAAVRALSERGEIPENAVFLTGLCGDMPSGSYLPEKAEGKTYTARSVGEALYPLIYRRYGMGEEFYTRFLDEIEARVAQLPIRVEDYDSFARAHDAIYTGACHVKFFLHMNDAHEYFGHEWLLPLWDKELLAAWYGLPAEEKIGQKFYTDRVLFPLAAPYGIAERKHPGNYGKNLFLRKIRYAAGGVATFVLLHLGIPFRRSYDFNNFAPLERDLFRGMPTHRAVIYRKAGFRLLYNQYTLGRRYGAEAIRKAAKRLDKKHTSVV